MAWTLPKDCPVSTQLLLPSDRQTPAATLNVTAVGGISKQYCICPCSAHETGTHAFGGEGKSKRLGGCDSQVGG
eukprot:CAMPEP_0202884808 /NCGR_PEP_ID=MMETSP1391-20130828/41339_1 /ASSEMBLY_ACC=CAM_ASM_000867 /TAXON_ID=1034604 /ORGANISM="Chlamydomonas leiostraca, Strain SAG 11-49" /LENGTH=73 /DNA_ID=CAMNT_0049568039 /DNA_START=2567 /DNA_END=2784 /DNA_ORIENTATION=+